MPKNRIGFSTDFNLTNSKVGIGTTNPRATLDVVGVLKGDFNISGVTTLTSYGGFFPQKQSGDGVTITGEVNTISEDIIVNVGETFVVSSGSTISIGTLESISIENNFNVPNGGITIRPEDPIEGTVRFNDDLNTLEFYNGVEWRQFTVTGASGRGVFGGGLSVITMDFINISTTGNALNFGTLTGSRRYVASCSSSTRGVFGGGEGSNVIDYITIASEGNAIDFGDLIAATANHGACSSSTRGIWAGGYSPSMTNVIQYVQIDTLGQAQDFGDLAKVSAQISGLSSPTRGVFTEQQTNPGAGTVSNQPRMTFITIASKGNSVPFGDLTEGRRDLNACANTTRGIFAGGASNNPSNLNTIDYITIVSVGNATDFGDLTVGRRGLAACSSSIRGVFGCGSDASNVNTIDFISINTLGNAQDFGDSTVSIGNRSACSDSHGGLGGF